MQPNFQTAIHKNNFKVKPIAQQHFPQSKHTFVKSFHLILNSKLSNTAQI